MLTNSDLETRLDLLFRLLGFEVGPHIKPLFPPTPKPEPTRKLDVALHAQGASASCPPGMQPAPPAIATPGTPPAIATPGAPQHRHAAASIQRRGEAGRAPPLESMAARTDQGRSTRQPWPMTDSASVVVSYPWRHHHQEASSGFTANQGGKLAATRETRPLLQDLSLESKQPKRV